MAFESSAVNHLKIYQLPQTAYDQLAQSGSLDANALYLTELNESTSDYVGKILVQNIAVSASAWTTSYTYADYPQQATIQISGASPNMCPEVIFDVAEASSGNFAPVARSANNSLIIYAKESPASAITIPTIILWK